MPVSYPKSSAVVADTDATATQYNNLRLDAVESRIVTLVAGEGISELSPVYVKAADGKAYRAYTQLPGAQYVLGFAAANATTGASVQVIMGGYMDGFSGLTIGPYFLGTSVGTISTSQVGAYPCFVGIAISATTLYISPATVPADLGGSPTINGGAGGSALGITFTTSGITYGDQPQSAQCFASYRSSLAAEMQAYLGVIGTNQTTLTALEGITLYSRQSAAGKTLTNYYWGYAKNHDAVGTVTNSFLFRFDGSSPYLTGVTTHDTESDEIKVSCDGTTKYIKLYT